MLKTVVFGLRTYACRKPDYARLRSCDGGDSSYARPEKYLPPVSLVGNKSTIKFIGLQTYFDLKKQNKIVLCCSSTIFYVS